MKDAALLNKMKDSCVKFTMTPESLRNVSQAQVPIPQFIIEGFLHATICDISSPFTGEVQYIDLT